MTTNKVGALAKPGTDSGVGGDTGLPAKSVFYCGRVMNQCRCGMCEGGRCGPSNGCPCNACVEIIGFIINSEGSLCKKGKALGDGGDTAVVPESLYYCGKMNSQCRCGTCDGQCGPYSGCPCDACVELVGFRVNKDRSICKRGTGTGTAGDTGLPSTSVFYCGKRKTECRCGQCGDLCGPRGGCPCNACVQLLGLRIPSPEAAATFNKLSPTSSKMKIETGTRATKTYVNKRGDICHHGATQGNHSPESGGDTGLLPEDLLYCSRKVGECRCGRCDLICGPYDGCPCSACLELVYELMVDEDYSSKNPDTKPSPSSTSSSAAIAPDHFVQPSVPYEPTAPLTDGVGGDESLLCIICLERRKEFILLPCGHYSYCGHCLATMTSCAVCRSPIISRVKVYEA